MGGLEQLTTLWIFHFMLIFCRLGAALMLMPGYGEVYVNAQQRLLFAFAFTLVLFPLISPMLPGVPTQLTTMFMLILTESVVGLLIGGMARAIQGVLHVAGMIIAFQSSLASALLFDPNQGSQGSVVGNFMTLVGVMLFFTTDLHHLMLQGLAESYTNFTPGHFIPTKDAAEFASRTVSDGFSVALKMSMPALVVGMIIFLGAGLMARLMPSMQVFFIITPLQIMAALGVVMISLGVAMMWYLDFFEETMRNLMGMN